MHITIYKVLSMLNLNSTTMIFLKLP